MKPYVIFLIAMITAGCAGPRDTIRMDLGKSQTLSMDATTRTILSNEKGQFCAEPPPDASSTYVSQLALTAKGAVQDKASGEAAFNSSLNSELVKMFQRSQGIQGLRDGMYRVCEAYLNGAIDSAAYQKQITNLVLTMNYLVSMEVCANLATTVKSVKELASEKEKSATDTSIYHYETCLKAARDFSEILLTGQLAGATTKLEPNQVSSRKGSESP